MAALLTRLKQEERERFNEDCAEQPGNSSVRAFNSKGGNFRKMSITDRKKITKCAKCGRKGHWAKECRSPATPSVKESIGTKDGIRAFVADDELSSTEVWISDSGASAHFCGDLSWFTNYTPFETKKPIQLTSGLTHALGLGTVELSALYGEKWVTCTPNNVLYVPENFNLFSESKCAKFRCEIRRKGDKTVYICSDGT